MDVNIEQLNKKHKISLDPSLVNQMKPIPENVPDWKKEIIKKKNEKLLNDAVQEAISNKDQYAGVPQWKKELLVKRDQEKSEYQRRLSADKLSKNEVTQKFESKPDWKKEIILNRGKSQDS